MTLLTGARYSTHKTEQPLVFQLAVQYPYLSFRSRTARSPPLHHGGDLAPRIFDVDGAFFLDVPNNRVISPGLDAWAYDPPLLASDQCE